VVFLYYIPKLLILSFHPENGCERRSLAEKEKENQVNGIVLPEPEPSLFEKISTIGLFSRELP